MGLPRIEGPSRVREDPSGLRTAVEGDKGGWRCSEEEEDAPEVVDELREVAGQGSSDEG